MKAEHPNSSENKNTTQPAQRHCINIDGQLIVITQEQHQQARNQLELPTDFHLVEATRVLQHHDGNAVVRIPLPHDQIVAAFDSLDGRRRYGVVHLHDLPK